MQIVYVVILLVIQQSYGLGIEAVQELVGVRLDAPVPLAVRKQREQSKANNMLRDQVMYITDMLTFTFPKQI